MDRKSGGMKSLTRRLMQRAGTTATSTAPTIATTSAPVGAKGYQYRPLSPEGKEIRLIDVHPPGMNVEEIRCSLRCASLASSPSPAYETVSYVWGDAKERAYLSLDGIQISVPVSSISALRRLRLAERTRTLWMDALCINQADQNERAQQVAIMCDIYSSSRGNLIYLGGGDIDTIGAIDEIRVLVREMHEETDGLRSVQYTVFDRDSDGRNYAESGFRAFVNFNRLTAFFSLPWFRYGCARAASYVRMFTG